MKHLTFRQAAAGTPTRRFLFAAALFSWGLLASFEAAAAQVEIDQARRGFTVRTKRIEATFRDGVIVGLRNLLTGEVVADETLAETRVPAGLGHISGDVAAMSAIHHVWGNLAAPTQGKEGSLPNYHRPGGASVFSCTRTRRGARAVWSGLHNETAAFPGETLQLDVESDRKGTLAFKATATSPTGGVFGVTIPIANIVSNAVFLLPSFGGLRYAAGRSPVLRTFGGAPFYEAPVMAAEVGRGSVGLWREDGEFHPFFTFFNWSGRSFAFAFEHLNLMPFEPHRRVESVVWRLDVTDGGWMRALAPYKHWYARHFARELKIRDGVEWADNIGVVSDDFSFNRETLVKLSEHFPPESVLMHQWQAREAGFTTDLPDWTPRKGYIGQVKLLHELGFKAMAYVNTYCAVYNSPAWIKDQVGEKFLTRKYSLSDYGRASTDREMNSLIGDVQGAVAAGQFANMKDGAFLYGDPLHPGWRRYHADQMAWWNTTTGSDANYEDTAGCAGDYGNGVVDGKFGAQGSVAAMRELLARQPGVPMASEYGPEAIAFAVKWPLVYAQVWGGDAFRAFRMHAQVPVNAYLYGYRTWIPLVNAGTDFLKHVVTACSDAAGGMGMTPLDAALAPDAAQGFTGHMAWRAFLFANRALKPYFDPDIREPGLVCMYRDRRGGLYRYLDDGRVQRMVDPDGRDLYARVERTSRLETLLVLPGWPATAEGAIFGLDPAKRYALFPQRFGMPRPPASLESLPEGVVVRQCRWDDAWMLLVLDRAPGATPLGKLAVPVALDHDFASVSVNGSSRPVAPGTRRLALDAELPAHILFAADVAHAPLGKPLESDFNRIAIVHVSRDTGLLEDRQTNNVASLSRGIKTPGMPRPKPSIALWGAGREHVIDFLIKVPTAGTSARVLVKNQSMQHGDAQIAKCYVNGERVLSRDAITVNPDWRQGMPKTERHIRSGDCFEWTVPLGKHAGNAVLLTIASDPKSDGNADQQWFSIPELVEDQNQQVGEKVAP